MSDLCLNFLIKISSKTKLFISKSIINYAKTLNDNNVNSNIPTSNKTNYTNSNNCKSNNNDNIVVNKITKNTNGDKP